MEFVRISGLEPEQTDVFEQWAHVFIDAALADNGESDERSATDLRQMERNPSVERQLMAVIDDGRVVAGASVMFPVQDNLTHSFATVSVLPSHRRRGHRHPTRGVGAPVGSRARSRDAADAFQRTAGSATCGVRLR